MKRIIVLSFVLLASISMYAQRWAIKTDAAWDLMRAFNVGVDVAVGNRTTLGVSGYACNGTGGKKVETYAFQPEYRYYFSGRAMHQHYLGVGALGAYFRDNSNTDQYTKAIAFGAGLIFGYTLHIGKRWNVDFHAGCGLYIFQKRKSVLDAETNDWTQTNSQGVFAAPTTLGVSFSYIIK